MEGFKLVSVNAKRVLVTGGAGFIGSHLCRRLLNDGNEVLCVDNFLTGQKRNIKSLLDDYRFEFIRHDINERLYVQVDQIYNLACPASPIHYQFDPVATLQTSVIGTINMLELARRTHACILQASTSEIYGDPEVHPQPESYWGSVNPIGPRACYDEGKRCAETVFFDYRREYDVNIKVARIFNTYGPQMHVSDGRVVSNFIVQSLKGEPLTIYGDGRQTRSLCYIDDLIEALTRLMSQPKEFSGPVNLGNPQEISVLELAETIRSLCNSKSQIVFQPLPQDDPQRRQPDISLARKTLGWEPRTPLKDGLLRTIEYFDALLTSTIL